ncbi:MAG: acetyl-CoA carboxylase carboxyltransferase subunit beta, partial [Blastocatellia bacterium]|nr:acetyl-CoA carboxylase carboxyltransferase subunit beta [Blastocatellia bacterium]
MSWFKRKKTEDLTVPTEEERVVKTEGLFSKCPECKQTLFKGQLDDNLQVCPKCSYHFKIDVYSRLKSLFDEGNFQEFDKGLTSTDPLTFFDTKPYKERLEKTRESTGFFDAVVSAKGKIGAHPTIACAMVYDFIGGSMGSVVGEKITRAIERAVEERSALIIVSASGGARMMEGALSLMQMAKISAALARLDQVQLPYISVLTDPTTGGVTASYAMLGDLNIAEPGALIGFAGPRVIEQTIRQKLPPGFQR